MQRCNTNAIDINEWPPWMVTPQTPGDALAGEAVIPLALFPKMQKVIILSPKAQKIKKKKFLWKLK